MRSYDGDPGQFVEENRETLVRIVKHGDNEFVRALALNALVFYGNEPDIEDVHRELREAAEESSD